jgi:Uma2 family endonuclease
LRHLNRFEDSFVETHFQRMSVDEFMAMEDDGSGVRYEYIDGELCALEGVSIPHAELTSNLAKLAFKAAGDRCRIFMSGTVIRCEAINCFFLPDLIGVCESYDSKDRRSIAPCFVIEVLSPSTALKDRHVKRLGYLSLPSLDDYVIVDQSRMHVEVFHRERGPLQSEVLTSPDQTLEISCIALRVPLRAIYQWVSLPEAAVA